MTPFMLFALSVSFVFIGGYFLYTLGVRHGRRLQHWDDRREWLCHEYLEKQERKHK